MKYIRLFETTEEYLRFKDSLILPNVSLCEDNVTKVYFNPYVAPGHHEESDSGSGSGGNSGSGSGSGGEGGSSEPVLEGNKVLCKYNVSDTSSPVTLYYQQSSGSGSGSGSGSVAMPMFSSMKVDGVEQEVTDSYTFGTTGEHTVLFTLQEGETSISDSVFQTCAELTDVTIGNSVTSIGNSAFSDCSSLTSITIPNSVASIGKRSFSYSGVTSVTIGNSVTSIGDMAFYGCSALTSITIPNSVTSIGDSAFSSCSGLTSITIGNSVASIGNFAFFSCSGLTSITCNATIAPTIKNNTFGDVKTGGTLTVPAGSTGYDVWMGTGDYYLGKYNWTKVEQ